MSQFFENKILYLVQLRDVILNVLIIWFNGIG